MLIKKSNYVTGILIPIITEHALKLTNRNKNHWSEETTTCSNNRMQMIDFKVMKLSFYNNFCGTRYYEACLEKLSRFINILTTQFSFKKRLNTRFQLVVNR